MNKKNILVFGGSKGIGRVFANKMTDEGHSLIIFSRTFKGYTKANVVKTDFCNIPLFKNKLLEVLENNRIDSMVFFQRYRGDINYWENEINTSLTATKIAIETTEKHLNNNGSIIIVSSNAAKLITHGQHVGYHVAKAGLEQMIRYFAVKLGKKGIRVNGVAPAVTIKPENEKFYRKSKLKETYEKNIPLQRMGTAEDVVQVIEFLMYVKFVTGEIINIDGGFGLIMQSDLCNKTIL